ncbi:Chemotaxis protein CheW [Sulfidibacter corallicola]|uniref:Chemotaxis protein CheW n=1 Tax=Sulfidibacter corallicola TaxID=2818388 RepID=A0A8A4TM93_SULCO|nr:chemotaxis protein CheW [Sulfidibacter corallicola]QTD51109.1 chemotaxis protein CheW [Sulfidibacter corallicola]
MLILPFRVNHFLCAVDGRDVDVVLPYREPVAIVGAPSHQLGTIAYGAEVIPLIDLRQLLFGQPSARLLGTRIALVRGREETAGTLALVAEGMTISCHIADEWDPVTTTQDDPLARLGPLREFRGQPLQMIEPRRLWQLIEEVALQADGTPDTSTSHPRIESG